MNPDGLQAGSLRGASPDGLKGRKTVAGGGATGSLRAWSLGATPSTPALQHPSTWAQSRQVAAPALQL